MSYSPEPPIVTDDDGDLQVYSSVADACLDLEAIDVLDGVYEAFDSRGRRLLIEVEGERVAMRVDPDTFPEGHELQNRLRRYIADIGPRRFGLTAAGVESASVEDLLNVLTRSLRGRRRFDD